MIFIQKHCIRVASQIAKRLKTWNLSKLGNIRRILKLGGDIVRPSAQSPLQKKIFSNSGQKIHKTRYQNFEVPSALLQIFCPGL